MLPASEGPCPTCSPPSRGGVGGEGDLPGGQVRGNGIIINLTERGEYVTRNTLMLGCGIRRGAIGGLLEPG